MHKWIEPNLARGQRQEEVEKFTGFLLLQIICQFVGAYSLNLYPMVNFAIISSLEYQNYEVQGVENHHN